MSLTTVPFCNGDLAMVVTVVHFWELLSATVNNVAHYNFLFDNRVWKQLLNTTIACSFRTTFGTTIANVGI